MRDIAHLREYSPELAIVAFWGITMILGTTFVQTMPFAQGLAWDSGEYAKIQLLGPMHSGAKPPFAFRILAPSLARLISVSAPLAAFRVLNAICLLLIPLLLLKWVRAYGLTHHGPVLLSIALLQFHGVIAWYFFCPVMVDLPSFVILLAALCLAKMRRNVLFALLMIPGALSKEFVMWALVYHFALNIAEYRKPRKWFLPLALYAPGVAAFLGVRILIPAPTQALEYYKNAIELNWGISTSVYGLSRILVGFAESLGPFMLLSVIDPKAVRSFCVEHREVVFLALVGVPFVFVGGTNLLLFWFYLFPAFIIFAVVGCHSLNRPVAWLHVVPALILAGFQSVHFITGWPMNLDDYFRAGLLWMSSKDVALRLMLFLSCLLAREALDRLLPPQKA